MFTQIVDPVGNLGITCLIALIPVVLLLTLAGGVPRFGLAGRADRLDRYLHIGGLGLENASRYRGAGLSVWLRDRCLERGLDHLLGLGPVQHTRRHGVFENFRRWLVSQGTLDIRVQTMLFAWAFGALLEGLVGFGYPWAVVAPILISLGLTDLDAIRVAAIANNAPVSYGALGAPIIALAAVTGYPLLALSGSVGSVVAVLALLPPWVLIYLVSGKEGFKDGWPLAIVGSLGYVLGQWPVAYFFGPVSAGHYRLHRLLLLLCCCC